jgi:hypothetical protein
MNVILQKFIKNWYGTSGREGVLKICLLLVVVVGG